MNTNELKRFAQEARKKLLAQVGARLELVLGSDSAELREKAAAVQALRKAIQESSKAQVIDRVAYTWFNRFVALRFMDVNDYQSIGVRVLTPKHGFTLPELLDEAKRGLIPVELPVATKHVYDLLDGRSPSSNAQNEAYKELLIGACNHLHQVLPFLFEEISDYTELLLPDDLISELSILHDVREGMSAEDCKEVEIIGWLYQFYISEKKDEVIGKVVKSEDIPAATQLFTPNWIVKYMVQNSLGAQWLATYPDSSLKGQMEYYIEPAEQTQEVQAQLDDITPKELDPEKLTLIDPASGSGHILVEAYELFKAIYLERGYAKPDVPKLILEKNLFGLDIDVRAAQLTAFALMMKGRADDRRLFGRGVKLNVMALQDSTEFDAEGLAKGVKLGAYGLKPEDLTGLKELFEHATTFGSLVRIPETLAKKLPAFKKLSEAHSPDLFLSEALKDLRLLVQQAVLLAAQYDAVVANPPYMGSKYQTPILKSFLKEHHVGYEKDFFSAFIDRDLALTKPHGRLGFMSPFVWMFILSYEDLRTRLINEETITSLVQLEYSGFSGATVPVCTFTLQKGHLNDYRGCYIRLSDFRGAAIQDSKTLEAIRNRNCGWFFETAQSQLRNIPGNPFAYWATEATSQLFSKAKLGGVVESQGSVKTGDNDRYIRSFWEVPIAAIGASQRWRKHPRGGEYRKWYGNVMEVVDWSSAARNHYRADHVARIPDQAYWDIEGICWSEITSSNTSFRVLLSEEIANNKSLTIYPIQAADKDVLLSFLNTHIVRQLLSYLNPTIGMGVGDVIRLPWGVESKTKARLGSSVARFVAEARADWDAYEHSWDFQSHPLLTATSKLKQTLESSYKYWITQNLATIAELKHLEQENNRLFIEAYGLQGELMPDVPIEQITLTVNPAYRYGDRITEEEQWNRFLHDTMQELVSYAVGCMMGRYSLDHHGLILANQGETLENYFEKVGKEKGDVAFLPDDDNIIPVLNDEWFEDDIVGRFHEFLKAAFGHTNFAVNLAFLEEALGKDMRKYFVKDFFADHIQRYKKRPIYWMFSSPKGSFNVLVYLHRYTPDTLNRVLNDYLKAYREKLNTRLEHLDHLVETGSASQQTKAAKEKDKLKRVLLELQEYERDVLYPLATERIAIDLDDGVLVNYNKFGKAIKEVDGLNDKKTKDKVKQFDWIDTKTIR